MLRINRVIGSSLALLLLAGAMAPVTANAWPLGKQVHLHPQADQAHAANIAVEFYNKGKVAQDVKVGETVYTVPPLKALTIKAPAGTAVIADTASEGHQKGDVLFTFASALKGARVSFE
jgi:hypothetical protein